MSIEESKNILLNRYKHNNATYNWIIIYYRQLKNFLLAIKAKKEGEEVDLKYYYSVLNYLWDKFLDTDEICVLLLGDKDLIDFGDLSLYEKYDEILKGDE